MGLLGSCTTALGPSWVRADALGSRQAQGGITENFTLQWDQKQENMLVHVERSGPVTRPTLGIDCTNLTPEVAKQRGVTPFSGLLITKIADGSPARAAGLRSDVPADVLMAMDGAPLVSAAQFGADFQAYKVGESVKLRILRGQTVMDLSLVVGQQTATEALPAEDIVVDKLLRRDLGADFNLVELPEALSERVYGSRERTILVRSVQPESAAWNAGLRPYDRLRTMNGVGVKGLPTLAQIAGKAKELMTSGEDFVMTVEPKSAVSTPKDSAPIAVSFAPGNVERSKWELWVPFVHYQESGPKQNIVYGGQAWEETGSSYWSVGPLDALASYRQVHYHPMDRSLGEYRNNVFHALLGLIRVETGTGPTKVRLLWFLDF